MKPATNLKPFRPSVDRMEDASGDAIPSVPGERALNALIDEIRRYLDVVELFRAEGCEPRWA